MHQPGVVTFLHSHATGNEVAVFVATIRFRGSRCRWTPEGVGCRTWPPPPSGEHPGCLAPAWDANARGRCSALRWQPRRCSANGEQCYDPDRQRLSAFNAPLYFDLGCKVKW